MTLEVLKALAVILEFCMNQDSCKNCPIAQWPSSVRKCHVNGNLILFRQNAAAPVWSRIFAQARSLEIKKQNG